MQLQVAEGIVAAMNDVDRAFSRLDEAVRRVEDEDERRRMLRVLGGLIVDSYHHITRPLLIRFPQLHPALPPDWRPLLTASPGLPVRRIDRDLRRSAATIHDERIYFSGVVAEDRSQDITGQTKQVLAEIEARLERGGSHCTRILSALIFLADIDEFAAMNVVWDDWIAGVAAPPARAVLQARLVEPDMKIEIMVVAAL